MRNMTRLIDAGNRYGVPVLAVTAVGKELVRDARYLRLACRICAELGAHFVKTYYCAEDFETVAASCPVPLIMAGGKKLPELEALTMAWNAVERGAAGVDMGRNIFQSEAPAAMIQAVGKVVHERMKPKEAFELYRSLAARAHPMRSRWSVPEAAAFVERYGPEWGEDVALRLYSSRLLGADPELVLHGGGNTSVKAARADILGESRRVLYVKASGHDLGALEPSGLPALDLEPAGAAGRAPFARGR